MNPDATTVNSLLELPWQGWVALGVLTVTFLLCAFTRLATDMVFIGGLIVLTLSGVLRTDVALAGFSNSGMITVAFLFVVVSGMQQTGCLNWISRHILGQPKGLNRALLRLTLPVMGLSAFLNNTPVVAMFIPVVNDWARKLRLSPSKLMIPLSYATILGGTLTMIGTSTNLVVNGLLEKHSGTGFSLFAITPIGLVTMVVGLLYMFLFSKLLPERRPVIGDAADPRQYTVEMLVEEGSPLDGQTIESAGLRHLPNLFLMEIDRAGHVLPAVGRKEVLQARDRLIFVGAVESILDLRNFRGLAPATNQVFKLDAPPAERCLIEAVVSNSCPIVGMTIREGRFRTLYNAAILAVARNGERLAGKIGDIVLRPGDTLLLEARPSFIERQRATRDFYLVSGVPDSELILHERAPLALAIMVGMVLLAAFEWMSMLNAAMLATGLMVATGCCSIDRARRSIEWQVLIVIGAALAIGEALESTGTATALAAEMMRLAGGHPLGALAVVYFTTMVLTEFITNNAAAALMFPIAMATAASLEVSHLPYAVAVMFAASASFATPIGYQTNLMVYGPGGYRFGDFLRIGVPLNLLLWAIAMFTIPAFFPF